ncbi:hypothetical protein MHB75_09120 [Kurthia sp. FSL E2-0154]|uniref:hypothetical protein n=1 Tax=Kurthia sp. FSL E2-0154 TaxID=2921358 RepID=UPI0030FCC1C0
MNPIEVSTKEELKLAVKNKEKMIIIKGDLAKKVHASKRITKMSKVAIATILAGVGGTAAIGLVAAPATGGTSVAFLMGAAGAAGTAGTGAATGVGVASAVPAIIIASAIGISLIMAVYKDYSVVYNAEKSELTLTSKAFKNSEK